MQLPERPKLNNGSRRSKVDQHTRSGLDARSTMIFLADDRLATCLGIAADAIRPLGFDGFPDQEIDRNVLSAAAGQQPRA